MRKTSPDMKVIFISGYAEEALRRELAEDESFAFPAKAVFSQGLWHLP